MHRDITQQLYLMVNELGRYKIGISNDPETRKRTIEMSSGVSIVILGVWTCMLAETLEKVLHLKFKDKSYTGEWFVFNENPIDYIDEVVQTEKQICQELGVLEVRHRKDRAYEPVRLEVFKRVLKYE